MMGICPHSPVTPKVLSLAKETCSATLLNGLLFNKAGEEGKEDWQEGGLPAAKMHLRFI